MWTILLDKVQNKRTRQQVHYVDRTTKQSTDSRYIMQTVLLNKVQNKRTGTLCGQYY